MRWTLAPTAHAEREVATLKTGGPANERKIGDNILPFFSRPSGWLSLVIAPVEPAPVAPAPDEPVKPTAVSRVVLRIAADVRLALLIVGSLQPARLGIVTGLHREIHSLAEKRLVVSS